MLADLNDLENFQIVLEPKNGISSNKFVISVPSLYTIFKKELEKEFELVKK